jgi:hypothetical protein
VVTFLRNVNSTRSGSRRTQAALLCIDRRDGQILLDKSDYNSSVTAFDVTATPEQNQVTIRLNGTPTYRLHFTDEPKPAKPTDKSGDDAGEDQQAISSRLSKVAKAIAEAIERHTAPLRKPPTSEEDTPSPPP